MKFGILGALGAVGRALVPLLAKAKSSVRVVGRWAERLHRDFGVVQTLIEIFEGDLNHS